VIYRLATMTFAPKFPLESSVHVYTHSLPSVATVIGIPNYNSHFIYTVVFKDGSISEYTEDLLGAVPTSICNSSHAMSKP
jgi:hypothetical protein